MRIRAPLATTLLIGLVPACSSCEPDTPQAADDIAPESAGAEDVGADPSLPGIPEAGVDAKLAKKLEKALQEKGDDYEPRTHHFEDDGAPKFTNRLILETSPYLLQHAHNPVNWFPALYAARQKRPKPHRDEKILTANNGLMISAFARGALVLNEPKYAKQAGAAAELVLDELHGDEGRLRRSYKDGNARHRAYLSDYAFLIDGLLDLYEATSEAQHLERALELQRLLDAHYLDEERGGYFMTAHDAEELLARDKPAHDGSCPPAIPSRCETSCASRNSRATTSTENAPSVDSPPSGGA